MKICSTVDLHETTISHNPKITKKVFISNGEIESITNFSRATFPPGEKASAHSHGDMTEVFYIETGQGSITVNEQKLSIKAGTCITVEPNETHELENTGSTDLVVFYFGVKT
jgi:mannose-6-phosphate isomerase-like protein (cupin superfamily)